MADDRSLFDRFFSFLSFGQPTPPDPRSINRRLPGQDDGRPPEDVAEEIGIDELIRKEQISNFIRDKLTNTGIFNPNYIARGNAIRFPEDVDTLEHFMTIRIIERKFFSRGEPAIDTAIGSIILPMPAELAARYDATYEPFSLTTLLAAGGIAAGKAAIDTISSRGVAATRVAGLKRAVESITTSAAGAAALAAVKPIAAATGVTFNPQKSLAFIGPELREHNLNLKLSPRSKKESDSIREIIRRLKVAMLPEYGRDGATLVYPYEFLIEFNHPEYLFATNRCVLKNLTVQYHNEGQAIYFRDPVAPVTVGLGMSFMETAAPFREDVESFPSRGVSFKGL